MLNFRRRSRKQASSYTETDTDLMLASVRVPPGTTEQDIRAALGTAGSPLLQEVQVHGNYASLTLTNHPSADALLRLLRDHFGSSSI